MSDVPCSACGGKCCWDDYGYRIAHMAAESYEHRCENCNDGFVPEPVWTAEDERAAVVAWLRDVANDPETFVEEVTLLRSTSYAIERGEHRRTGENE